MDAVMLWCTDAWAHRCVRAVMRVCCGRQGGDNQTGGPDPGLIGHDSGCMDAGHRHGSKATAWMQDTSQDTNQKASRNSS